MARRKASGLDLIAAAPWPVGIVLGILAYFGVRYGFTLLATFTGNPTLAGIGNFARNSGGYTMLAWTALVLCWAAALASFIRRKMRKRLLETQTGLDSLRAMTWRQFEMLVGEAFRRQGYCTEETGLGGADGGIDLLLRKNGKATLVQCKQWRSQRVDVKVVREMYGLLAHHGADAVTIATVGDFTPDARRFSQGKPIELIHGEALLAMIRGVQESPPTEIDPPAKAAAASTATPDCPSCGAPMVKRTNRRTREAFWGCSKYPGCRGARPA
ncbi:MAG TPA: restriction endonuclease [Rhodanobacteraceae bacterium]|nr:restriction endonuclease [Rhodanobacteraceae bacterium]